MTIFYTILITLSFCLIGYLLGNILFSVFFGWIYHKDVRKYGSKNPGATNTWRVLGKPAGFLVACLDAFKAWFAVVLAWMIFTFTIRVWYPNDANLYALVYLAGAFAVLGHCFPFAYVIKLFKTRFNFKQCLPFKGGKGVAPTGGVIFSVSPWLGLVAFGIWCLLTLITRYVSVGSIFCMFAPCAFVWIIPLDYLYLFSDNYLFGGDYIYQTMEISYVANWPLLLGIFLILLFDWAVLFYRHRTNMVNIKNKTEKKIFNKRKHDEID